MNQVAIYRDNLFLYGIKPEKDSTHIKKIMGENELRINFVESQFINFKIGDKANIFGEWFYLNVLPVVSKIKTPGKDYSYSMVLQGTNHILSKIQYLFLGDDNSLKEGEFSLTGKAVDFLNLIINNTKRLLPTFSYSIQQVIQYDYRTLTFSSENCLEALAKISREFDTEYWVDGLEISLTKKQKDTGYTFKHGKRKGLYEIIRQTVDNQNVITRVYAFGSDKNLPEGYRNYSKRLRIPNQVAKNIKNVTWVIVDNGNGTQTYTFTFTPAPGSLFVTITSRLIGSGTGFGTPAFGASSSPRTYTTAIGDYEFQFITIGPGNINYSSHLPAISSTIQPAFTFAGEGIYLEKNIDLYGVSEATIFFEDIFPHRTGVVSAINAANVFEFSDTNMDFDVNAFLLPGATAKVTFNSGQLTGYTFDVSSYDNTLKKFIILKNKNERAIDVPSATFKPAIGDNYVIIDIKMPQTYIDAAELLLQQKAQEYLDKYSTPQLSYQLIFDPVYLKEKGYNINIGDLIWIIDTELEVQKKIRVISTQRNIINEYDYTIEISDTLPKGKLADIISAQGNTRNTVFNINRNFQNNSILNNRVIGDLYLQNIPEYADNAAALAAGLIPGQVYRTDSTLKIVHA